MLVTLAAGLFWLACAHTIPISRDGRCSAVQQVPAPSNKADQGLCPAVHPIQHPGGLPKGADGHGGRPRLHDALRAALHQCTALAYLMPDHHGERRQPA